MQISKSIAEMIARTLVTKKAKEITDLTDEYHRYVYNTYVEQTPAAVKRLFKKSPNWFHTRNNIVINNSNYHWKEIGTSKPVIGNTPNGQAHLHLTDIIQKRLDDYTGRLDKLKTETKLLQQEITTALLQLRTTKRIAASFPEAKKYLPKENMSLIVNVDPIREKLKRIA